MQDVAESSPHTRVFRRNCSLYFGHATVAFWGQLESGSSVINTTEGRELSMDVSPRELASTLNNSDVLDSPFQFSKPGYLGRPAAHDFPPKLYLKKNTHSAYSA